MCFGFLGHTVVLRVCFWFCSRGALLSGVRVPYVVPAIDLGFIARRQVPLTVYYLSIPVDHFLFVTKGNGFGSFLISHVLLFLFNNDF